MAEFLITEAVDVDSVNDDNNEGNINTATVSDQEFIDDEPQNESDNFYPYFTNVSRSYDDAMRDFENVDNLEARNYFDSDEDEEEIDEFVNFESKVTLFKQSLINPQGLENPDSFFYSILYAIRNKLTDKIDSIDEENLKIDVGLALSHDLFEIKSLLKLDLDVLNFENQCFKINTILNKYNMFLRVFELKNKFRYLFKQNSKQKNILSEVSACVTERFNGFTTVRIEFDNKIRRNFTPVDIIYKPVKRENEILNCFFTQKLHLAYRTSYNETKKWETLKHSCAFQCYYCSKFYTRKGKLDIHMKNCTGKPGFIYNFQTRNLLTFEENLKFKRDVPLTAYIDFETTATTDDCLDPESNKMNVVSYVIILAFHPKLNLPRIIIERSFGHSLQKLSQIDYLTSEQLKCKDIVTLKQLRDCAIAVNNKKNPLAVSEMFCTEIKFATNCVLTWFYNKYKNLELNMEAKRKFEEENPIDWDNGQCSLCTFPLEVNPTTPNNKNMSYGDFVIKKEHIFLRNIFSKEQLLKSPAIATFEAFHKHFIEFLEIVIFMEEGINTLLDFSDCSYPNLIVFFEKYCSDFTTFEELKQEITNVEIKGYTNAKIPKFKLQLYAFVYDKIMSFPFTEFECETVTTADLFQSVHRIINVKIHLHHSHVTGEIKGYGHDFCNWLVRENHDVVPCVAHNFFKFDMFFLLKGIRLSVWRTTDINIGGNNLTDVNLYQIYR